MKNNERQSTCKVCNATINAGEGFRVKHNATNYGYICYNCLQNQMAKNITTGNAQIVRGGYSLENSQIINEKTKTNNCTISIECEIPRQAMQYNEQNGFKWLVNQGYYETEDCTVYREFKSPICNNLLGISKVLHALEKHNHLEAWHNDESYGTHLNIGNTELTPEKIEILKRFYHSLFVDYSNYLENNIEKTIALHGRNFTYYASPISDGTNPDAHCNFINLQHNTHIEFRLCKLYTAPQYVMVARMYQEIVQNCIIDYFFKYYNELMPASKKRELAKKTSRKMIKTFDKYYNKLMNA